MSRTLSSHDLHQPDSRRVSTWMVAMILLAAVVVQMVLASSSTLWDRDEPRFARAAVEMLGSGDWLVPTLNGELRPDKPILIYWFMAAAVHLLGLSELALRLPSILGFAAAGYITYHIGRRMLGPRAGLRAMAIFLTMLAPIYIGSAATADGILIAFITLAHLIFIDGLYHEGGHRWWHFMLLAVALGLAQLAKGPVGLAVPVLSIIGYAWLTRKDDRLRLGDGFWRGIGIAIIASVGIFVAWGLPANLATGGDFAREGLGRHVLERMFRPQEGHGGRGVLGYVLTLPLYVPLLIFIAFPWIVHLPGAISGTIRGHVGDARLRAVLVGWCVPTFVLMSLVATKLPHYILPIFPALALGISATLNAHRRGQLSDKDRDWLRGGVWFFAPVAVGVIAAVAIVPWFVALGGVAIAGLAPGLLLAGVLALVLRWQLKEQTHRVNALLWTATPITVLLVALLVMPALERLKISDDLAAAVKEHVEPNVPVYMCGYQEPSLVFYLNLPAGEVVQTLGGRPELIVEWARQTGPAVVVMSRHRFDRAEAQAGPLGLEKAFRASVINYSARAERQEVLVLKRGEHDHGAAP